MPELADTELLELLAGLRPDSPEPIPGGEMLRAYEKIHSAGMAALRERLPSILHTKDEVFATFDGRMVDELASEPGQGVTETQLFRGLVGWCRAQAHSEEEAIHTFRQRFLARIRVERIPRRSLELDPSRPADLASSLSDFLPSDEFHKWEKANWGVVPDASRGALDLYKVHQTRIGKKDFLEPGRSIDEPSSPGEYTLWRAEDHFHDSDINIRIYQKIATEGIHVPRGKFGVLLEVSHQPRPGGAVTERVSVKMIARKGHGVVTKKVFKPVADSSREGQTDGGKENVFVLSKNRDERQQWEVSGSRV
jgi:hypothetical protein